MLNLMTTRMMDVRGGMSQNIIARTSDIPQSPLQGERYLSETSTLPWQNGKFMTFWDGGWTATTPEPGQVINIEGEGVYIFDENSQLVPSPSGYYAGGTYVDAQYGNDATGRINMPGSPFATIDAAKAAVEGRPSPRLIWVNAGTYSPTSNLMDVEPLNYYFAPGTVINFATPLFTATSASETRVFGAADFVGSGPLCNFSGSGVVTFYLRASNITSSSGTLMTVSAPLANVNVHALGDINVSQGASVSGGKVEIDANNINYDLWLLSQSGGTTVIGANVATSANVGVGNAVTVIGGTSTLFIDDLHSSALASRAIQATNIGVVSYSGARVGSVLARDDAQVAVMADSVEFTQNYNVEVRDDAKVSVMASRVRTDTQTSVIVNGSGAIVCLNVGLLGSVAIVNGESVKIAGGIVDPTVGGATINVTNCQLSLYADYVNANVSDDSIAIMLGGVVLANVTEMATIFMSVGATFAGYIGTMTGGSVTDSDSLVLDVNLINGDISVTNTTVSLIRAKAITGISYSSAGKHYLQAFGVVNEAAVTDILTTNLANGASLTLNNCTLVSAGVALRNTAAVTGNTIVIKNSYIGSTATNAIVHTGAFTRLSLYETYLVSGALSVAILGENSGSPSNNLNVNSRNAECSNATAIFGNTVTTFGTIATSAFNPYS